MRLLGTIKKIEGKPRTWEGENGTVYFFTMIFEAEGNKFIGEYAIAPSRLAPLGIAKNAVGYFDLAFNIVDVKNKETGAVLFQRQGVKFSKWSLANSQAPANEDKPKDDPEQPADGPAEGTIDPQADLTF